VLTCKVIATYIGPRPVRTKKRRERRGIRLQDLGTAEKVLDLLHNILALEKELDPGDEMDTYLVCNGGCPIELLQYDGVKTPGGELHILQRENIGLSFGAYAYAFDKLRQQYSRWLLTEDDVVQVNSGYLPVYEEVLNTEGVGFVATVGLAGYHNDIHAHGGCGYTSTGMLDLVAREFGGLPFADKMPEFSVGKCSSNPIFDHVPFCHYGEIPLTNTIYRAGQRLKVVPTFTDSYYDWSRRMA
jgi:hypothetical protein